MVRSHVCSRPVGRISYRTTPGKTGGPADADGHQFPERRAEHAMTLLSHLGHPFPPSPVDVLRRPARPARTGPLGSVVWQDAKERPDIDPRIFAVQRLGAVSVGLFLLAFGTLGAAGGVGFLSTHGGRYLGLSSNGLLSAL